MIQNNFLEKLSKNGNIRVVIGNGFDLFCGLHTTYSNYYCKYWKKYKRIQIVISEYVSKGIKTNSLNQIINECNIWDTFFAIHSSTNPEKCKEKWCEIEKLILESLLSEREISKGVGEDNAPDDQASIYRYIINEQRNKTRTEKEDSLVLKMRWPELKKCVTGNNKPSNNYEAIMVEFIKCRMKQKGFVAVNYYEFILDELKDFEKTFGDFVNEQTTASKYYKSKAEDLLDVLCPLDDDEMSDSYKNVYVDSFNYTHFHNNFATRNVIVNHINGDYLEPIFGVDSCFEPSDPRFIFTKTSRRMESKMIYQNYPFEPSLGNVVIFGHSLNEADYSYYYPIFDKLKMLDNDAKSVVVFAYNIHDKRKTRTIKSELRQNVVQMFFNYAKDKQIPNPKRFVDSISTQKRIFFFEVDDTIKKRYESFYDPFEENWKEMIKNMKEDLLAGNF